MKYFTYELWTKMNSEIEEECIQADNQWLENCKEYEKTCKQLEGRMSNKAYSHFWSADFHDYRLQKFQVFHSPYGNLNPVKVKIVVTNDVETWKIIYMKVKKMEINYDNQISSFAFFEGRGCIWQRKSAEFGNGCYSSIYNNIHHFCIDLTWSL